MYPVQCTYYLAFLLSVNLSTCQILRNVVENAASCYSKRNYGSTSRCNVDTTDGIHPLTKEIHGKFVNGDQVPRFIRNVCSFDHDRTCLR